jgi:hypothetical protein
VPLGGGEHRLYRAIREAVPVVDAAIYEAHPAHRRLYVKCGDPGAEALRNSCAR